MDNLLNNKFTEHYKLPPSSAAVATTVMDGMFSLRDTDTKGGGMANFANPDCKTIAHLNYESFVNSLPDNFTRRRKRCDYIVYTTSDQTHFLLCELVRTKTDGVRPDKRRQKREQLRESLHDISAVPDIKNFMAKYGKRRCCLFNARPPAPLLDNNAERPVTAPVAFNPPLKLEHRLPYVEVYGFEPILYEYSGASAYAFD